MDLDPFELKLLIHVSETGLAIECKAVLTPWQYTGHFLQCLRAGFWSKSLNLSRGISPPQHHAL